ncbi:glycosyltransferase family 4 protein [Sporobolomyces salmoneus]|uniref:glycosyltransferase family 4 protein n=1 Tax=Sporobolomyces salmoneus TaxID=183962 RepID=UPI003172E5EE
MMARAPASPSVSQGLSRSSGRDLDLLEKAHFKRPASTNGKRSLRVAIVTENFLPKVDGVTRTLAMLLEHLAAEGHEAMVLGPASTLKSYAGHEVVSTKGIPLLGVYKGLGLNFIRPLFIRKLKEFKPDVIQFVDPIWLCAQTIPVVQRYFPDTPLVSSYHTNLAMYATLFGFSWLTPVMWGLQRSLHGQCAMTFCPSPSTSRMLKDHKFENVRLWPRGVDVDLFRPDARDFTLRQSWGVEPPALDEHHPSPRINPTDPRRTSFDDVPLLSLPPAYDSHGYSPTSPAAPPSGSKLAVLYVGRISFEKNLRLLIEAFRGLERADPETGRPPCQLVFVGDGPARTEVEALCNGYNLGAKFLGFKKGEELAACFASSDIFAFPSWTETFGQVVSEAQSCGLPVVGLRAEGVCDLVEHGETGLLLDMDDLLSTPPPTPSSSIGFKPLPPNPHTLVGSSSPTFPRAVEVYRSLLVRAATQHEERRRMGLAAHKIASKRSWFGAMEMLVDGYREVITKAESKSDLSLSRTSTIEFDIVTGNSSTEEVEEPATMPRRRRRLRQSSQALITFSKDESTQALCVRLFEISVLLLFVFLSLRCTSTWQVLTHLHASPIVT